MPGIASTVGWRRRVDWFNHRRLLGPIGDVPPADFEQGYYEQLHESARVAGLTKMVSEDSRMIQSLGTVTDCEGPAPSIDEGACLPRETPSCPQEQFPKRC